MKHHEHSADQNIRSLPDTLLAELADYILSPLADSPIAMRTANLCLMDSLGCMILALSYPACTKLLGPIIPETIVPNGSRVPGTNYVLDPILAAFNIGCLVRWLDFNDTWLAAEWGHPSDSLGAILALGDYLNLNKHKKIFLVRDIFEAMIKAHEIQGILALKNSFNRLGFDHVILVKIASTAIATYMLGGSRDQIIDALSQAFVDGACLRTYRHAPNTGPRKSWAAGDATSRAVRLAWFTLQGEIGYPSVLSTKKWGFNAALLGNQSLLCDMPFGTYVMEHILFKVSYPAEFHAQTAVEAAIRLHPLVQSRFDEIDKIVISTQESAIRIISKEGPLHNPADRDHCIQYMVAIALLHGTLDACHYEDTVALDPRIDWLRNKMQVIEDQQFSIDYLNPQKRSIANSVQLYFNDGTSSAKITIEYPLGHRFRREESLPALKQKFINNLKKHYPQNKIEHLLQLFENQESLEQMPIHEFLNLWVTS